LLRYPFITFRASAHRNVRERAGNDSEWGAMTEEGLTVKEGSRW